MSADEEQLKRLRLLIEAARKKAAQLRSQAAATDARADAMVKEASTLGTGVLPLMSYPAHKPELD